MRANGLLACFLAAALLSWTAVAHAERQSSGQAKPDDGKLKSLAGIIQQNGVMAGALKVCEPPAYEFVLNCTSLLTRMIVDQEFPGQINADKFNQEATAMWDRSAALGYKAQSSSHPPLACPDVIARARQSVVFQMCHARNGAWQPPDASTATSAPTAPAQAGGTADGDALRIQ